MSITKSSISSALCQYSWRYRYYVDNKGDAMLFKTIYDSSPCRKETSNQCVVMFNGKAKLWHFDYHGGLADRLKGMVSIYKACKETDKTFKILHTLPFPLERFLVPNLVDWRISENEMTYNLNAVSPHWLRHSVNYTDEKAYSFWRTLKLLKNHRTVHLYSNTLMVDDNDFRTLFHELFRPSAYLLSAINQNKAFIGQNDYISLSYRFTHLLGDPVDVYLKELAENTKVQLLNKAFHSIICMHQRYPGFKLLVNSDSVKFLSFIKNQNLDYVHITPGTPVHIEQPLLASETDYLKTFLVFYSISGAEKVFLVRIEEMRNSGFPKIAAMMGGRPFEVVTIE